MAGMADKNATTCSGDVANFHNSHEINPDEIKKCMKIRKYFKLVIYNFKWAEK